MVLVTLALMEHIVPLIGEARDHQRWRRRRLLLIVLAVAGIALAVYAAGELRTRPAATPAVPAAPGAVAQPPSEVLSRAPYMGVACPRANSIGCDRVGLAVWLKRPARSARAMIDGRSLHMSRFGNPPRPGTEYAGYLVPAGIASRLRVHPLAGTSTWLGGRAPSATVRLVLGLSGGRHVVTHLRVPLMAGWG
jgi:hypothetical protein